MSLLELYNRFASLFHKDPNTTLILLPSTPTYNHITPYDIYVRVANTLTAVQYTRLAAMSTGCGVEKCSDAVWLCSRMIGAVWQLGSPLPCAYPYFLLPPASCLLPTAPPCIFRFQFSEAAVAAAVINRVVMRCQIRIMYVAIALATGTNHNQTFNRVRACHSQQFSNCCAAPHRHATPRHAMPRHAMMASGESGTFSVFHVRWQRVFFHQRIGSTSVQCKRYSTIFRME